MSATCNRLTRGEIIPILRGICSHAKYEQDFENEQENIYVCNARPYVCVNLCEFCHRIFSRMILGCVVF